MTTSAPQLDGIVGWVVDLMETLGAPGVGLAIALENVFPPLPSEVFLPLAGFAAARGDLSVGRRSARSSGRSCSTASAPHSDASGCARSSTACRW
jgi:hypothetical protein